jgi:hypothetical protein
MTLPNLTSGLRSSALLNRSMISWYASQEGLKNNPVNQMI